MRILLDENLDWRLRRYLVDHQVESVPLLGWAGIQNGELLNRAIEAGFAALVTMEGNMVYQQNISRIQSSSSLCGPSPIGSLIRVR